MSELIKYYQTKYFDAVFGYYAKLEANCFQLKHALEKLMETDYCNGSNPNNNPAKYYCESIREFSKIFLMFFSSENNQVPPKNNHIEWGEKIIALQEFLNKCLYIGIREPDEREKFIEDINIILNYFTINIPKRRKEIMNKAPDLLKLNDEKE
ncbi:MAG: hypothetical protein FWD48_02980 [Oscillospiraceae bacterium]|nr:hypothetical protein [Oscillospiraceae bacterium]